MQVKVERVTSWLRALNAARWTIGKEAMSKQPSEKFIADITLAEHSPIRLVEYDIKIEGVFAFVANHLVRHFIGTIPFVCTSRDDRTGIDPEKVNRLTPVNLQLSINVQALINISNVRLCNKAHVETIKVWQEIREKIAEIDPIVARCMVRKCVYRGFCPEIESCGYTKTKKFKHELKEYRNGKE